MFSTGRNGIGRRHRLALGLSIVALGLAGSAVGASFTHWLPDDTSERIVAAPPQAAREAKSPPTATAPARKQMPIPVRISIPAIGVDAAVVALGKNPDGTMEVPTDAADTAGSSPAPSRESRAPRSSSGTWRRGVAPGSSFASPRCAPAR